MSDRPDFKEYTIEDLKQAWIHIDDRMYPDRATEIYLLLQNSQADIPKGLVSDLAPEVLGVFGLLATPVLADMALEDAALRDKENV